MHRPTPSTSGSKDGRSSPAVEEPKKKSHEQALTSTLGSWAGPGVGGSPPTPGRVSSRDGLPTNRALLAAQGATGRVEAALSRHIDRVRDKIKVTSVTTANVGNWLCSRNMYFTMCVSKKHRKGTVTAAALNSDINKLVSQLPVGSITNRLVAVSTHAKPSEPILPRTPPNRASVRVHG